MISVIVPTFNAAPTLGTTLRSLAHYRPELLKEIVVADGGSSDETVEIAHKAGCIVVCADKGRGPQLRAGANVATQPWLLFLHADSRPSNDDWARAVRSFVQQPESESTAGVFSLRLDDDRIIARILEQLVAIRVRVLALPYGDQGLLMSCALYREVGGFAGIPLMEDIDIVRRIGRRRLRPLPASIITSAEKYRRDGYFLRSARNLFCLGLYFIGVPPSRIVKLYG
jgi:rSAM/selenodomain-associated transferase 2